MKPGALTIGGLAKRENVNRQTIRYYERRGLIAESSRTASGYRLYGNDAARRLAFIRRAKQLGFSLIEIEGLLALRMRPGTTCSEVRTKARQKMTSVDEKIAELQRIRTALATFVAACRTRRSTKVCPILEMLDGDGR